MKLLLKLNWHHKTVLKEAEAFHNLLLCETVSSSAGTLKEWLTAINNNFIVLSCEFSTSFSDFWIWVSWSNVSSALSHSTTTMRNSLTTLTKNLSLCNKRETYQHISYWEHCAKSTVFVRLTVVLNQTVLTSVQSALAADIRVVMSETLTKRKSKTLDSHTEMMLITLTRLLLSDTLTAKSLKAVKV